MKKLFLFSFLAVFLAWAWFGGVSMAENEATARIGAENQCTTVEEDGCYATLADAITNAKLQDTITLLNNTTWEFTIPSDKEIVLSLWWKTITAESWKVAITNNWKLTIEWEWNIVANWNYAVLNHGSLLTINWGTFSKTDESATQSLISNGRYTNTDNVDWKYSEMIINWGNFEWWSYTAIKNDSFWKLTINWGIFNSTKECLQEAWSTLKINWGTFKSKIQIQDASSVQDEVKNVEILWWTFENEIRTIHFVGDANAKTVNLKFSANATFNGNINISNACSSEWTNVFSIENFDAKNIWWAVTIAWAKDCFLPAMNLDWLTIWWGLTLSYINPSVVSNTIVNGSEIKSNWEITYNNVTAKKLSIATKNMIATIWEWTEIDLIESTANDWNSIIVDWWLVKKINSTWKTKLRGYNITIKTWNVDEILTSKGEIKIEWWNVWEITILNKFPANHITVSIEWEWNIINERSSLENPNVTLPNKVTFMLDNNNDESSVYTWKYVNNWWSVSKPEDPTKEGNIFVGWFNWEEAFNFETAITADTTLTAHWATALTASEASIKAANIPSDEWREKRNLDKFSISNSYDATSKTLTVTITDNWMKAYTGWNSENAKKWLWLIADFGVIVNWSAAEWVEKYTIWSNNEIEDNIDRTDANIYWWDADSSTDFIIWINREDKDWKTIRFVNAAAEDDYVNVKFVFKDKQSSSSSSSSGWGGGGGSSSSSCKNLPSNAVANNTKKPSSSTSYFYDTDTTKVCSFVCKKGYEWVEKTSKCEAVTTTTTTWDTADTSKAEENKSDIDNNTNTTEDWYKDSDNDGTLDNGLSKELVDAYIFSHDKGITTMNNPVEADMFGPLNRIAMAKMLSQYAINVLGKTPDTSRVVPTFPDVDEQLNKDYNDWVTLAYQLGIMWINIDTFRPFDLVTRAEFGTALSRMLFGLSDGEEDLWYKPHLDKLMNEKIITIDTPDLQELRGYVMIMLMRSAQ